MEILRPLAAEKLGIEADKVEVPYDLLSLMPLDQLWTRISNRLNVMVIDVSIKAQYTNEFFIVIFSIVLV